MPLGDRAMWAGMRMDPTDIADITGAVYTYLINGHGPQENWTGLFRPGERVRLRFINGSAMSYFDVRIPGLKLTIVASDGQPVHPVTVDEFRIATAETFDVIVEPTMTRELGIEAPLRSGKSPHELFVQYLTERDAMDERVVAMFDELHAEAYATDQA